jgi:hypothetical protein
MSCAESDSDDEPTFTAAPNLPVMSQAETAFEEERAPARYGTSSAVPVSFEAPTSIKASTASVKATESSFVMPAMGFMAAAEEDSDEEVAPPTKLLNTSASSTVKPAPTKAAVSTPVVATAPTLSALGFMAYEESDDEDPPVPVATKNVLARPPIPASCPVVAPPPPPAPPLAAATPRPPPPSTTLTTVLAEQQPVMLPKPPVPPPAPKLQDSKTAPSLSLPSVPTTSLTATERANALATVRAKTPELLSPSALRQALKTVENEFQISKSELLSNLYYETKRTPMGRVMFERYKSSDASISVLAMQTMCYEFGVYLSLEQMGDSVQKYASLPEGEMIYQDFMIWWLQNEQIRYAPSIRFIVPLIN